MRSILPDPESKQAQPNPSPDSLDRGINDGARSSSQGLASRLCSVHLQNVCGDVHNEFIVSESGLLKRELGLLKARYQLPCSLGTPASKEFLASQRRDEAAGVRDELLIGLGKRADRWAFLRVALTSHQCEGVAPAARLLVGRSPRRGLRGRIDRVPF